MKNYCNEISRKIKLNKRRSKQHLLLYNLKKNNLPYLVIIVIGLLTALISFFAFNLTSNLEAEDWTYVGLWASELAGFFMLLINGTLIKTKHFRLLKGSIALIIIGALFKILHWEYHKTLIVIGFLSIVLIYFLSFLNKPIKKRLNYLKLAWVIIAYTGGILTFLHIIGPEYHILQSAIMWLAIIDYLKIEKENRRLFE